MDKEFPFAYPEDLALAERWLAEKRISKAELAACFRIQRCEPPPPRTLKAIASACGIDKRMPPEEALRRFEDESKHCLARDRTIADQLDDRAPPTDYSLVREMGRGGQGEVFMAQQHDPRRLVVLKRLLPDLALDGKSVLRFLREALLMERVNDPLVAEVFDYGTDGDTYFIALEYVAGDSLAARLERFGWLPLTEALEFTSYAAEALAAVADGGVVHGDVKPSNLVIPVRGTKIKLIDFGAAVEAGHPQSEDGGWFGSPPFMAPEQFRSEPLTPATDMYALGIMLFVMLTGELPFSGRTAIEIGHKHMHEPLPSLLVLVPGLSPRVAQLVRRMAAKQPEERLESFGDLKVELERIKEILGDEQIDKAPSAGLSARRKPPVHPDRTVSAHAEETESHAE